MNVKKNEKSSKKMIQELALSVLLSSSYLRPFSSTSLALLFQNKDREPAASERKRTINAKTDIKSLEKKLRKQCRSAHISSLTQKDKASNVL